MIRRLSAAALLAAAGCSGGGSQPANTSREEVAAQQAQVRINPGEWELATVITGVEAPEIPREMMQAMQGRRRAVRHCVTPEQASDPSAFGRSLQRQSGGCQVQGFTMRGGQLEGQTLCAAGTPREVRSQMSGRYGPDSFDYQTRVTTPAPIAGGVMNVSVQVQGRRVGDCPAGAPRR